MGVLGYVCLYVVCMCVCGLVDPLPANAPYTTNPTQTKLQQDNLMYRKMVKQKEQEEAEVRPSVVSVSCVSLVVATGSTDWRGR